MSISGDSISAISSTGTALKRGTIYRTTDTTVNYTSQTTVPFEAAYEDTDNFWNVSNPSRLTVPAGLTKIKLFYTIHFKNVANNAEMFSQIWKNGSILDAPGIAYDLQDNPSNTDRYLHSVTSPIDVTAGDYFEVGVNVPNDSSVLLTASSTWFMIEEVVE